MKAENGCLTSIIKRCSINIIWIKWRLPLFIPNIPTFHYSIIPCGLPKKTATKRTIIPICCRNFDTSIDYELSVKNIERPAPGIQYRASSIQHPASNIQQRSSEYSLKRYAPCPMPYALILAPCAVRLEPWANQFPEVGCPLPAARGKWPETRGSPIRFHPDGNIAGLFDSGNRYDDHSGLL